MNEQRCLFENADKHKGLSIRQFDILICPECHGSFRVDAQANSGNEVVDRELVCQNCLSRFPIISGIPRFLSSYLSHTKKKTANNFGYSWKVFSKYYNFYLEQFLDWIWPVTPQDLRDKVVLDAGCGNGRHIYQTVKFGAKEVVGFDLSEAIDIAYMNTKEFKNVCLLQADIYNLPLRPVFDYIYCIGVLHHLPNSEEGFKSLVKLLKKDGRISIWVYAKEGNSLVRKFIDPIRLYITSRMPHFMLYLLSFPLACFLYAIAKFIIKPLNTCPFTKSFVKFLPLNDYLNWVSKFNFRYSLHIVFDQLVAVVTHYISKDQIEGWFKRAGLKDINISFRNKNSWRGIGAKVV